jgi:hypothetical protein
MRIGKPADAESEIRAALAIFEKVFPPEHRQIVAARSALGESLLAQGKMVEAEALLVGSARQLEGVMHYERRRALQRLVRLYEAQGKADSAHAVIKTLADFDRQARTL